MTFKYSNSLRRMRNRPSSPSTVRTDGQFPCRRALTDPLGKCHSSGSAERFQQGKMLPQSRGHAAEIVAPQALALSDRENDRSQRRIVGVRDIWKQVVLDLVVEAPRKPGGQSRF